MSRQSRSCFAAIEAALILVTDRWSRRLRGVHDDLLALDADFSAELELFRDAMTAEVRELFADSFGPMTDRCERP